MLAMRWRRGRTPRARWWARSLLLPLNEWIALVFVPSLGIQCVILALLLAVGDRPVVAAVLATAQVLVLAAALVLYITAPRLPRWYLLTWARARNMTWSTRAE